MKQPKVTSWAQLPVAMTPHDCALLLGCTDEQVRRLCKEGIIKAVKVSPRHWIIPKSFMYNFIENNQEEIESD